MEPFPTAAAGERAMDEQVRLHLVEPIVAAAHAALGEMAGVEVAVRGIRPSTAPSPSADLAAVVGMRFESDGFLILRFPRGTAAALAQRVLVDFVPNIDETLVRDCVGEIANVVAGQAKAMLAAGPFRVAVSRPQFVVDLGSYQLPEGFEGVTVDLACEAGEFALTVFLKLPTIWA